MNRLFGTILLMGTLLPVGAQRMLNLDSCRALALRNNKQLSISKMKQEMARNVRKSARTKYLPHVTAYGAYEYTSREVSILNDGQKSALSNMGTTLGSSLSASAGSMSDLFKSSLTSAVTAAAKADPANAQALQQMGALMGSVTNQMASSFGGQLGQLAGRMDALGQQIVDAFRTDTRQLFAGSIMVTQPVFMGGSIIAMNKLADIGEDMAVNQSEAKRQLTLYNTDQAYWTIVSLKHKKALAESYLGLVKKLDGDVAKMIKEGVATRSEGLSVNVKVNEAEMQVIQVNDGLVLAKMYLCQLCGLPMNEELLLADEDSGNITLAGEAAAADMEVAMTNRPELKMLQNTVDLSKHTTSLLKAGNLPQVLLMGGYAVSNPNVYNGFQNKFAGMWNVGVTVRVPVWNWGDVMYKVRASKNATAIAALELDETREMIELQVSQVAFKVAEANKKLALAMASTKRADENLRCANLGFKEGVIQSTAVLEAQTAWLQAQSQKIDAEIDVKLSQVNLKKALGTLQ